MAINDDSRPEPIGFMLIGAGPHVQRTYIPHLREQEQKGKAFLRMVVDLEQTRHSLTKYLQAIQPTVELAFVPPFLTEVPEQIAEQLNEAVVRLKVSVVIISTEPLVHKAYGVWALRQRLHIIMDKPISVRSNSCSDLSAAYGIAQDYTELLEEYEALQRVRQTCFLVNSHRRYHPGIQSVLKTVKEVQALTGCPVTNVISTHCDGMWRMPAEIVDQSYHTFNRGYGKVSHSGYHFLDSVYRFLQSGWSVSKRPDCLEVVSSFLLPNGFLTVLGSQDYR